jgi:hypothetical protein
LSSGNSIEDFVIIFLRPNRIFHMDEVKLSEISVFITLVFTPVQKNHDEDFKIGTDKTIAGL